MVVGRPLHRFTGLSGKQIRVGKVNRMSAKERPLKVDHGQLVATT